MIRSKPNCLGIALRRSRSSWGERHPIVLATYDEYKYMALILEQQKVLLVEDVVDEVATPRVLLEMCIIGTLQGKRAFDLLEALEALNTMNRSQTEDTILDDPSQVQARVLKSWKKEKQVPMMKSGAASVLIGPEKHIFLFGDATAGLDTLDARKEMQVHVGLLSCGQVRWASQVFCQRYFGWVTTQSSWMRTRKLP